MHAHQQFRQIWRWSFNRAVLTSFLVLLAAENVRGQSLRTAKAEATLEDGYVVGLRLTDPGAGYGTSPGVALLGGGGSGATAVVIARNGMVDTIRLVTSGSGYSSAPEVAISAPSDPLLLSVSLRLRLVIRGEAGETHRIFAKNSLTPTAPWLLRTNLLVAASPYQWEEPAELPAEFYRVQGESQTPVIESAQLRTVLNIQGTMGTTNWILGTEAGTPRLWQVLAEAAVTNAVYEWVDEEARAGERHYQVTTSSVVPLEMNPQHWVWIPPGRFIMGSPPEERGRSSFEGPQTFVTLTSGFWLGRCEVTQREYLAVMGANPSFHTGDLNRPVESVRWYDATNYCATLTALERAAERLPTGYEYRLPTEAQWEYACRAGSPARFWFGDAIECDDRCGLCASAEPYLWWCGNSRERSHPVGQTLPNPWGLRDMHGNVYEWCLDWWGESLPGGSVVDPPGPASGTDRVLRGGSWYDLGQYCRSAARGGNWPRIGSNLLGFRAALVAVP